MYWSHFGLDRQPFRAAVDPGAYFPALAHEEALAALTAAAERREAAVLVDGPMGVGKSLVARKWLDQLPPERPRVFVPNAHADRPAGLLQAILFDMGVPYQGLSDPELRLATTAAILDSSAEFGGHVVLVLDEAQHLSQAALEEFRMLTNLETGGGPAVFAILVAQPMLREALRRPAYELVAQRVAIRAAVVSLTHEESAEYLRHQVRAAGGTPDGTIEPETIGLIAAACDGIPRLLNRVAAVAFDLAASAGAEKVDVEAAMGALDRLGLALGEMEEPDAVLLPHPSRADEPAPSKVKSADRTDGDEDGATRGSKDRASRKRTV